MEDNDPEDRFTQMIRMTNDTRSLVSYFLVWHTDIGGYCGKAQRHHP